MADIADFVAECQVNFHSSADDSRHCIHGEVDNMVLRLEGCISDIGH